MNYSIYPQEFVTNEIKEKIKKINNNFNFVNLNSVSKNDYIFVFGGDGTFLKFLNLYLNQEIKIILINKGRVGFLSSIEFNSFIRNDFELNDYQFDAFYFLNLIIGKEINLNAINEIQIETKQIDLFNLKVNNIEMMNFNCSKMITINNLGSSGYARSLHYPLVFSNQDLFIFDILDAPQYKYNSNLNQSIIFNKNNELNIEIKNKQEVKFKIDNRLNVFETDKFKIKLLKSKCKILNISSIERKIKNIQKLF